MRLNQQSFPSQNFCLPTAKEEGLTLQRYDDVDLVSVEKTISLTETETAGLQPWYYVAGALVLGIAGFLTLKSRKTAPVTGPSNVSRSTHRPHARHLAELFRENLSEPFAK